MRCNYIMVFHVDFIISVGKHIIIDKFILVVILLRYSFVCTKWYFESSQLFFMPTLSILLIFKQLALFHVNESNERHCIASNVCLHRVIYFYIFLLRLSYVHSLNLRCSRMFRSSRHLSLLCSRAHIGSVSDISDWIRLKYYDTLMW